MRLLFLAMALSFLGCGHQSARPTCSLSELPPHDQGHAAEVLTALVASPTWIADLKALSETLGRAKVDCLVAANVEELMQIANRSPDDSFVVEPHLAIGVERGREWLRAGPSNANVCAGH